jgi:hypothetical protein
VKSLQAAGKAFPAAGVSCNHSPDQVSSEDLKLSVKNYFNNVKQKNEKLANISRVHRSPFCMKLLQIPEVFPLDKHFSSFHRK